MLEDSPHVCIDCRTLVGPGAACDVSRFHRVAALETPEGRAMLRTKVWGPPELRERAAQAARVGGLGSFFDGILQGCGGCPGGGLERLAVLVVGMVGIFLIVGTVYWLIAWLIDRARRYRHRLRPVGVGPLPPKGSPLFGRIVAGGSVEAPLDAGGGVAWGVVLDSSDAIGEGRHVLFAGASAGFRVELEDGRVLEVPGGRVRIDPRSAGWRRVSRSEAQNFAAAIDRRGDEEHPPVPADRGRVLVLRIGDRVAVSAETQRAPAEGGGYREGAAVLRALGVPRIALA